MDVEERRWGCNAGGPSLLEVSGTTSTTVVVIVLPDLLFTRRSYHLGFGTRRRTCSINSCAEDPK